MAWYHVGSCDCPVGCCDCGTPEPKVDFFNTSHFPVKQKPKGKCTGCGLRSKDSICWRCSTVLEAMNEDEYDF